MTAPNWTGQLFLGSVFALYQGRAGDTDLHSHYAVQCIFSPRDKVTVVNADGQAAVSNWHWIPSGKPHQLKRASTPVRILFFEPATAKSPSASAVKRALSQQDWLAFEWEFCFGGGAPSDPRLKQALNIIDAGISNALSATELSARVGLSRNRFMIIFKTEIGVPVRRFILWRRLRKASDEVARGANLTEAAHRAGFSDSAHFARTMKMMFGVTPRGGLAQLKITPLNDPRGDVN